MTDKTETITVRTDQTTVSMLVWRRYRRPMPGLVERILALNIGLASSPFIPVGTEVVMPIEEATQQNSVKLVTLW
ncbi:tail protein X [Marivivens aquimaris]|uniref:tail protein X n=1 Tax=Marivivens aquimaris TaxID=2774876 RepID=UPI00187E176D|nr:tail protein X [Marivivens aquimaris]